MLVPWIPLTMYELADIKRMRRLLGLTQAHLASVSGVSQSLIAKIEAGKVDPSYTRAKKIFEVLESYQKQDRKSVADIMVTSVITVPYDAPVGEAVTIMNRKAISQLPIVRETKVIGSLSEKVIVERIARGDGVEEIMKQRVESIMDQPFPTVSETAPLEMVAKMLNYCSAVLVYDGDNLAGIVTRSDLLKKR
jgi:predicted transcriptional regulator